MTSNPLILQLSSFSRKEMTRFCEFASSPYFNKHKDVKALVTILSEAFPDFSEKKCNRNTLFKQLFPGKAHHQPNLAIVFTYTLRLFQEFLVVEEFQQTGAFEDKTSFARQLRKRNLLHFLKEEDLESNEKAARSSNAPNLNIDDIQRKYRAAAEQDAIGLQLGHPRLDPLLAKQHYLDVFYALEKLRDACELHQRARLMKADLPHDSFLEALVNSLEADEGGLQNLAVIKAYQCVYKLLGINDLAQFQSCLDFVKANAHLISKEDLQQLLNYLQNHCIEQINKGHQSFLLEVFRIYQFQLDNHLLMVNGILPEWHFKNIVTTGLRIDQREWVRKFMEEYKVLLPANVASNAYNYNLAAYYYHIGKPEKVLPLLVQLEYTDLRYNLDAKSLLLRTYFDLEEDEALMAHCEAFKQFVKRNKTLTEFQKQGYFNFISFATRAYKLRMKFGFTKLEKWREAALQLQSELVAADTVFNKPWLVSKMAEMIAS